MDSKVTEGKSQDGVGSLHTQWSDDTVINQWWGRIRSVPGNNTLPLIISATMQPTDHTSTGGGRLDDREVGHANKMVKGEKKNTTTVRRMQTQWQWCDDMWKWKMENMQHQPDIWERAMQCWADKTEKRHADGNLQPITARRLQIWHVILPRGLEQNLIFKAKTDQGTFWQFAQHEAQTL